MACLARLAQARPFFIQTGSFRNHRLREGYIPPLPWCGAFLRQMPVCARGDNRPGVSGAGTVLPHSIIRFGRGVPMCTPAGSRGRLPLRILSGVQRVTDSATGGGTPPLRILSVVRQKMSLALYRERPSLKRDGTFTFSYSSAVNWSLPTPQSSHSKSSGRSSHFTPVSSSS